jgi:hypothetical protein
VAHWGKSLICLLPVSSPPVQSSSRPSYSIEIFSTVVSYRVLITPSCVISLLNTSVGHLLLGFNFRTTSVQETTANLAYHGQERHGLSFQNHGQGDEETSRRGEIFKAGNKAAIAMATPHHPSGHETSRTAGEAESSIYL